MPPVARALISSSFVGSVTSLDRNRSLALGGNAHWTLNVETSYASPRRAAFSNKRWQSIPEVLSWRGSGGRDGGGWPKMSNEPLAREPIDRVRARLEALVRANAAPRCGARCKRMGKPCRAAAMPNGRCKVHGGKSTGPRTPEGLERSRRANWKHGRFSREAKAEPSRVRAAILALRYLCIMERQR